MIYQLGTVLTDAIVLSIIEKGDTYGYAITQQIKKVTDMKDSALYPVLRRLQQSGFLTTYDRPWQGRNRRYYRITEQGKRQLTFFRQQWVAYRTEIERMLMEGENHE
ncbi:MAG: PadR family transcriptional regulator [Firmicutes bacterium]|nr:PadR family transcriptional regulator [Bacillota bacterium]